MFPLSYKGVGPEPTAPYTLPIDIFFTSAGPTIPNRLVALLHSPISYVLRQDKKD